LELQGQLLPAGLRADSNDLQCALRRSIIELAGTNLPKASRKRGNLIEPHSPGAFGAAVGPVDAWACSVTAAWRRVALCHLMNHRNDPDEQTRY